MYSQFLFHNDIADILSVIFRFEQTKCRLGDGHDNFIRPSDKWEVSFTFAVNAY